MVAVELEVMAKKMDRFGWERDRGSHAHDRLVSDWMQALQDYPLDEVQAACRKWVSDNPRKMPNEGDIKALVIAARRSMASRFVSAPQPERKGPQPADQAERARIAAEVVGDFATRLKWGEA